MCVVALSMFLIPPYRWWKERKAEQKYNQKYVEAAKKVRHASFVFRGRDIFNVGNMAQSQKSVQLNLNKSWRRDFYHEFSQNKLSPSSVDISARPRTLSMRGLSWLSSLELECSSSNDDDDLENDKPHDSVVDVNSTTFPQKTPYASNQQHVRFEIEKEFGLDDSEIDDSDDDNISSNGTIQRSGGDVELVELGEVNRSLDHQMVRQESIIVGFETYQL